MCAVKGGKDQLEREVMAWGSHTVRCFLDQLHLCKATSGTVKCPQAPLPNTQIGKGPHFFPGEASRGVKSRLQSYCQPSLALCPELFPSRDTKAQLEVWHTSPTAAATAQGLSPVVDGSRCCWNRSPHPVVKWDSPPLAQVRDYTRAYPPMNTRKGV